MDYARLLSRAPCAIRYADVRSGFLPSQSRFRGNDEPWLLMFLECHARIDQTHAFAAIGREIARFDTVVAR